jgi:hypothetical protein
MSILKILIAVSGLIDAGAGIWFLAAAKEHPLLGWVIRQGAAGIAEGRLPSSVTFLSVFLGLACLLAAGLQLLALLWLRDEREEAYSLLNLYGGFAVLAGLALFLAFTNSAAARSATPFAAGLFVAVVSLRGALLLTVGNVVHLSPSTLSELRLPSPSRAEARTAARPPMRSRSRERAAVSGRGRDSRRTPERRPAADRGRPAPARAPVRAPAEPVRAEASPVEDRGDRGPRRPRGRRGRRGGSGRGRDRERVEARPLEGERPVVERRVLPDTGAARGREEAEAAPQGEARSAFGSERRRLGDAGEEGAATGLERRGPRTRDRRGGRRSDRPEPDRGEEAPRRTERPVESPAPPEGGSKIGLVEGSPLHGGSSVHVVTPAEFEAGRRPKRGRHSISGALFRPREKRRVHRHLGPAGSADEPGRKESPGWAPEDIAAPEPPPPPDRGRGDEPPAEDRGSENP